MRRVRAYEVLMLESTSVVNYSVDLYRENRYHPSPFKSVAIQTFLNVY